MARLPLGYDTGCEDALFEARHRGCERTGFNLHSGACVAAEARVALERLCRYVARSAVVGECVERIEDGRVAYRLKHPRQSGETHRVTTEQEFMARLVTFIPPPRSPLVQYLGVFAPHSPWRAVVEPGQQRPIDTMVRGPLGVVAAAPLSRTVGSGSTDTHAVLASIGTQVRGSGRRVRRAAEGAPTAVDHLRGRSEDKVLDPAALRLKRSLQLAMFPSSITLKRYRCFEEEQTLPVRRITLIYGENNTGKSALVRLLPLVADSCDARSTAPLNEESKAMRGSSFLSQFWHEEREGLELALSWGDLTARYAFSVREDGTHQSGRIERCGITRGGDLVAEATLHRGPRDEQKLGTHVWRVGGAVEFRGSFRGLIPDVPPEQAPSIVAQLRAHAASCSGSVQWLHARRMPLRSEATALVGPQWQIMPDGGDVIRFLSSQPAVVDRVRAWFGHHQKLIFDVSRESQSKFASLVLRDSHARGWGTNMADGSEGLQFTVPVLASLGLISMKVPEAPKILALEEPEGHLHGRLQRALAEEIIDVVERTPDARVVIETHSPIFLTALQLAIVTAVRRAQDAGAPPHPLAPSEVAVCLLERVEGACTIRTLDLDEEGAPRTSELMDFFSEEHAIASDLRRARSER